MWVQLRFHGWNDQIPAGAADSSLDGMLVLAKPVLCEQSASRPGSISGYAQFTCYLRLDPSFDSDRELLAALTLDGAATGTSHVRAGLRMVASGVL
jgi:hypothetical protein